MVTTVAVTGRTPLDEGTVVSPSGTTTVAGELTPPAIVDVVALTSSLTGVSEVFAKMDTV